MTDLSITVNGMKFENPFVLGSGPPGTGSRTRAGHGRCLARAGRSHGWRSARPAWAAVLRTRGCPTCL